MGIKDGYWIVRTYESGAVGEKIKYWISGARPDRRSLKAERDAAKKQAQNDASAVKQFARLINANYTERDYLIGLDYSDEGLRKISQRLGRAIRSDELYGDDVREAAEHELRLCVRRVKRQLAAEGIELRIVSVTSDMNGDTGEPVRVHHHLIVNAEARDAFLAKWQLGGVSYEHMFDQLDYTPLAEYLMHQVRRIPDARKYTSSRNLIRPAPKDRVALSDAQLRAPKGGKLLYASEFRAGAAQYIRYMLPPEKWHRKKGNKLNE